MHTIKRFIDYYAPYKAVFFIDLICAAAISIIDLAYPQILRTMTNTLFTRDSQAILSALPLIAAGGIASGEAMLASMVLGAEGVQIGTLFALTEESSAADAFKQRCVSTEEGDTMLCLKKLAPTRLIKNSLYNKVKEAEDGGASPDELRAILGQAASKRGIFEGDTDGGELEIGQIASAIKAVKPVAEVMKELVEGYEKAKETICN